MSKKFRFSGLASVMHLNARKEGPDEDKQLALDVKLKAVASAPAVLGFFDEALQGFLFTDIGAVRNVMMGTVTFAHELEDYRLEAMGSQHFGVKVKKFAIEPMDGWGASLTFSLSFKPSGDEVARLAEYLQDDIEIIVEPTSDELDLGDDSSDQQKSSDYHGPTEDDPLYPEAANLVVNQQRASTSFVQRHLRIGYNRAARLIEEMEKRGICSSIDSSGSRSVLVSAAQ